MTMPRGILFLRAFVRALIRSLFFTIGNLQDSFAKMRVRRAYWFRAFRHRLHPLSSRFKPRRFICVAMILVMAGQSFLIAPQITQAAVDAISTMAINYAQDAARRNPNFRPEDDGTTHCNQATYAVAKAVGAPLGPLSDKYGTPLRANQMAQNLAKSNEYREVGSEEAQQIANGGGFVIAAWENPSGKSGHVATVRPEGVPGDNPPVGGSGPLLNDIGANVQVAKQSYAFGKRPVRCYTPGGN